MDRDENAMLARGDPISQFGFLLFYSSGQIVLGSVLCLWYRDSTMTFVKWSMLAYGLAMIAMGVQSYFFPHEGGKPSPISLIAAGSIGILVIVMMVLSFKKPRPAYIATIVFSLLPIGQFLPKLLKGEGGFYPQGLGVSLSLAMIAILVSGHLVAMKRKKSESAS